MGEVKLTKAQRELLERIVTMLGGEFIPFHSDWSVFYKLKAKGFADYMPGSMRAVRITDAGRAALTPKEQK